MTQINSVRNSIHSRLDNDLKYFCEKCLKISPKEGDLQPFIFNKAQKYLHSRLENQYQLTGKVRALVLKGRQQGCSTYVAARYYHKAIRNRNKTVYILSHEAATTLKLFGIVKRYHEFMPESAKPVTIKDTEKSIVFSLNSEYCVGTAGNKNTGRGGTVQLLHGSEVGFYENTDELQTGLLQSIADIPNTEIILESTANGMGNFFHKMCMEAIEGNSDYELIFIPWFWQDEYTKPIPQGFSFSLTDKEKELLTLYLDNGMTIEHLVWRRSKIAGSFTGNEWKFKQEYPNNAQEAFQTTSRSMISSEKIMLARKRVPPDPATNTMPLVAGCDTARVRDRIVRVRRRGRVMYPPLIHNPKKDGILTVTELAGLIAREIEQYSIDMYFIDATNGWGVIDILHDMGFRHKVKGVVFSETKSLLQPDIYVNKRAELLISVRDWFETEEVCVPDDDAIHADFTSIPEPKETASGKFYIVTKDKIKADYGMSPDIIDAFGLTFAFPVRSQQSILQKSIMFNKNKLIRKSSELKTLRNNNSHNNSNIHLSEINLWK